MELTQQLLSHLLQARITKVPHAIVGDKAKLVTAAAEPLAEFLVKRQDVRWWPTGAFEVQEERQAAGNLSHDFVIFAGRARDDKAWGLCAHYKNDSGAPALSLYLLPQPNSAHLTQFRTFAGEVLRCLAIPAHLSFVHFEKTAGRWKVRSMRYSNGADSPIPKQFYKMILAV